MAGLGMAGLGWAWHGTARRGSAWQGKGLFLNMTEPTWAIITTRAMCEDIVERGFWQAGYRAYVARYRKVLQPHGRHRTSTATMRPVFQGLVFVQDWRGWPQEKISHVVGRLSSRSGRHLALNGADVALIMERERAGMFDLHAPRPPANGVVARDDLTIGEAVEFDLSGQTILATLDGLSDAGRATVTYMMLGRSVTSEVDAETLHEVSGR